MADHLIGEVFRERLYDHFQPALMLLVLGREVLEQFLEGEVRLLGKSGYCLGGAKEIIMVNPSALDRETTA